MRPVDAFVTDMYDSALHDEMIRDRLCQVIREAPVGCGTNTRQSCESSQTS